MSPPGCINVYYFRKTLWWDQFWGLGSPTANRQVVTSSSLDQLPAQVHCKVFGHAANPCTKQFWWLCAHWIGCMAKYQSLLKIYLLVCGYCKIHLYWILFYSTPCHTTMRKCVTWHQNVLLGFGEPKSKPAHSMWFLTPISTYISENISVMQICVLSFA